MIRQSSDYTPDYNDTVIVAPHTIGAEGFVGVEFQRHSRTVIVFVFVSIEINWNDNFVSSLPEIFPFIGEST